MEIIIILYQSRVGAIGTHMAASDFHDAFERSRLVLDILAGFIVDGTDDKVCPIQETMMIRNLPY